VHLLMMGRNSCGLYGGPSDDEAVNQAGWKLCMLFRLYKEIQY
jgi:hypothetical protein